VATISRHGVNIFILMLWYADIYSLTSTALPDSKRYRVERLYYKVIHAENIKASVLFLRAG